ncbi:MAG TPA: ester cyclase [Ktedonobacteraceae bacterium]|jgi:predicted ester cyclase|nr:ester cyclase [Ktedonobacteraceae bacterium]
MSNTDIVKAGLKAWESNDEQTITALVAGDFKLTGPVPQPVGKQEFIQLMHVIHTALPDFAFNISSYEEHGDTVIAKSHITGTHTGILALPGLPPIPPTGKKVSLPQEVQTLTLKDGKLHILTTDAAPGTGIPGLLAQIGVEVPVQ